MRRRREDKADDAGAVGPRRLLVSGNWKMNLTHLEAIQFVQKLSFSLDKADLATVEVSLHPAFTALRSVQTVVEADRIPVALGAQNVHWDQRGAYTGEVSPLMLAKLNVRYVIVGHSERRQLFGETDEMVNHKVRAVTAAGMVPICCVGETFDQHEAGVAHDTVAAQVRAAVGGLQAEAVTGMVIAYEPIWAVGTGRTATAADAQAMCATIRATVAEAAGKEASTGLRLQYGGSVKPENAAELLTGPDVDGALVGGASLDPDELARIVAAAAG